MSQLSLNLYEIPFEELFGRVKEHFPRFQYDFEKHMIKIENNQRDRLGYIRLPMHVVIDDQLEILSDQARVLYVSIESGNGAICLMDGKINAYHTTFSAYMTRKKQGVSQIKYLNKKGKSRAGSRVRLAKTLEFFEEINTTLTQVLSQKKVDRIAINCSTTLVPYLHQSKVACPFGKKDARLYKIPLHISQSNFTHLDKTIKKLLAPILFYDSKYDTAFESFL
ncbi:hypothetical protein SAMN04488029_0104 [Reichenbachiella faecimaris]|uniref:VLRF1 domain-containing protein n=1 Tax=Reichenbachiella faecimaris TaxID=692418 RepID=A0A1W2G514_REIFA|nr:hypothetical protein [Reichenbachiella faecimaris]SMD31767.1 hypothetical protein SAMN04488029_0104 [Reichenbachiella faecimaris]